MPSHLLYMTRNNKTTKYYYFLVLKYCRKDTIRVYKVGTGEKNIEFQVLWSTKINKTKSSNYFKTPAGDTTTNIVNLNSLGV